MTIQHKINFPVIYQPRYETPLFNIARARGLIKEYGLSAEITYHLVKLGQYENNYKSKILIPGVTVGECEDLDHVITLINNYRGRKNLLTDIPITNEFRLVLNTIDSFYNKSLDYDCIILSVYKDYMFANIYTGLIVKLNNPNIDVIIGGPNINLSQNVKQLLQISDIFDYVIEGDIEEALKRYLNDELLPSDEVYDDLNKCAIPIYTNLEIRLFKNIVINGTRGCCNICSFCTGNHAKFRSLPINYIVDIFKYYNDANAQKCKIYMNDNTVNYSKRRILDLTNNLIDLDNKLRVFAYLTFEHLNDEIITNLFNSNIIELYFGIDGLHLNKQQYLNMTKIPSNYLDILKELYNRGFYFDLSYIYNTPGETREIFEYEFDIINNLKDIFPSREDNKGRAKFCMRNYNHFAGSNMYQNPAEYGIIYDYWKEMNCSDELNEIITKIPKYYYCNISKEEYDRRVQIVSNFLDNLDQGINFESKS